MSANLSIGLVDDNDDDAANFARAFEALGTVSRWSSGEHLLEELGRDPGLFKGFGLLLLDLNLPGADGVSLLQQVRTSDGGDLPVVMLTGSAAEHDILRALEATADEYEVKPNDLAGLRALVARCAALARPQSGSGSA